MNYELNNIGHDEYLVFSRGHHDIDEFTKYVKQEYSEWGNFFDIAYHHYYRKIGNQYGTWYELWYAANRTVPTELRTFDSVEDAELFITFWLDEGRL